MDRGTSNRVFTATPVEQDGRRRVGANQADRLRLILSALDVTVKLTSVTIQPPDKRSSEYGGNEKTLMARRMASIECFRVVAMFAVILTHSNFVANLSQLADGRFLVVISRYLVWGVGVLTF